MRWIFWTSAGLLAYTYVGYMGWLRLRSRWRRIPVRSAPYTPSLSVVMVVRNEEKVLDAKLQNLLAVDYPEELFEIVVVSDGSSDGTGEILSHYAGNARVRVLMNSTSRGKAAGLNDGINTARGDLIVFTDARQMIEPGAFRALAENFADSTVGCASGELMLGDPEAGESASGLGLYWRIEKAIREAESSSGSVVGATGAIYAVRRNLLVAVPAGTILDDVFIPMHVAKQGGRVVFNSRARAWDLPHLGNDKEFWRKVRTLSGNYQLVQLAPWLLTRVNPIRFEFVSHKLLRLAAPLALTAMLIALLALALPLWAAALIVAVV